MSFLKKLFNAKDRKVDATDVPNITMETYADLPGMTPFRLENLSICLNAGFTPARSLPTEFDRSIQPAIEIAKRLHAIKALVLWLLVPEDELPSDRILHFVEANELKDACTEEERQIFDIERDNPEARNWIGWKFENAWSLAWYFGYTAPEISGQMMTGEQMQEILSDYSCPLDGNVAEWTQAQFCVSTEQLIQQEDLFYCLHNAVRSAQLGEQTVPSGFNPMINGGVIHERRHSLTWMLSNGTSWDETDLST